MISTLVLGVLGYLWFAEGWQAFKDWRTVRRERQMLDHELDLLS